MSVDELTGKIYEADKDGNMNVVEPRPSVELGDSSFDWKLCAELG